MTTRYNFDFRQGPADMEAFEMLPLGSEREASGCVWILETARLWKDSPDPRISSRQAWYAEGCSESIRPSAPYYIMKGRPYKAIGVTFPDFETAAIGALMRHNRKTQQAMERLEKYPKIFEI